MSDDSNPPESLPERPDSNRILATFTYDETGRLIEFENAEGDRAIPPDSNRILATFTYDETGRLIEFENAEGDRAIPSDPEGRGGFLGDRGRLATHAYDVDAEEWPDAGRQRRFHPFGASGGGLGGFDAE